MKTIAITSEKGGQLKTGTTTMFVVILALLGIPVVAFDFDPQAQTCLHLGHPRDSHKGPTIKDVILAEEGGITLKDIIIPTFIDPTTAKFIRAEDIVPGQPIVKGPDLVPITLDANTLDYDMKSKLPYWPTRVAELLETIANDYEYAFFDCPPGLLAPTMSVYSSVEYLLFPVTPDKDGVEGFQGAISAWKRTQKRNTELKSAGYFFQRVHNWRTDKDVMQLVKQLVKASGLDIPMIEEFIGESKDYNEAMTYDESLVVLSRPNSQCARSYWIVLHQLLQRIGGGAQPLVAAAVAQIRKQEAEEEVQRQQEKEVRRQLNEEKKKIQKGA